MCYNIRYRVSMSNILHERYEKIGERDGNIYDAEFSSSYAVTHTGGVYNLTQVEHNDPAKIDSS